MTKFPTPKQVMPEWATYIETRRPKFKMHNGKGQATNALNYHHRYCDIQLFRLDKENDEWILEVDYKRPDNCARCQATLWEDRWDRGEKYWYGNIQYYDWDTGKSVSFKPVYTTPQLCHACYEKNSDIAAELRECERYERLKEKFDDTE